MKKVIAAVLAVFMAPAIASAAGQTVRLDPFAVANGGYGIGYQHNLSNVSALTVEYASYSQSVAGVSVSAGIVGVSYKKAFSGNTIGEGAFWRAGAASVTVGATDVYGQAYSLSAVLPTLSAGYDYKLGGNWVLTAELGLATMSILQVGYTF